MTSTLLNDLRDAVRDEIAARLPELKSCKTIEGKFSLEELKKSSVAAPAVYVSCYGAKSGQILAGGAPTYVAEMAAYIVARDALGLEARCDDRCHGAAARSGHRCRGAGEQHSTWRRGPQ